MSSPIGAGLFGLDEDSSDPDVPDLLDSHVGSSSGGGRGGKSSSGSAAARRRRRREEKVQGIAEVAQLSAMALSRRMTQVHKSRLGADLEIELSDGSRERVHRAILATVSQGFKTMLIGSGEAGKFAEADMDVVKVEAEAPAFAALVEYAYTGQIHVKSEHVMSVVQLADQFGIDMLKLMASTQAYNDLTDDNVIDLLNAAANYNATALVKRCVDYLAPRAETVLLETNAHEAITRDALVLLLGVDELCVEELDLLHFVMRWGEYQLALHPEAETVQRVLDGIIELVRFGLINSADLHSKVLPLGLVPPEVILDAVLVRTMGKTKREKLGLEKPRPRAGGQRFEFETLQDQNGIIYAIATKMGQQAWTNPHDAGIVTVSLSSSGGSHVRSCVDRNFGSTTVENSFGTSGRVDPWLQLDFRNYRVSPHMYTVHQERDAFIRSWNLEGSEDAVTWTVLSEHRDDTTIQSSNLGGAFEVTDPSPEKFRYLRLHLTGPSHNGNKDFDITQIEFYGLLSNSLVD